MLLPDPRPFPAHVGVLCPESASQTRPTKRTQLELTSDNLPPTPTNLPPDTYSLRQQGRCAASGPRVEVHELGHVELPAGEQLGVPGNLLLQRRHRLADARALALARAQALRRGVLLGEVAEVAGHSELTPRGGTSRDSAESSRAHSRAILAESLPSRSGPAHGQHLGQLRPSSAHIGPDSTEYGPNFANVGPVQTSKRRASTGVGRKLDQR